MRVKEKSDGETFKENTLGDAWSVIGPTLVKTGDFSLFKPLYLLKNKRQLVIKNTWNTGSR